MICDTLYVLATCRMSNVLCIGYFVCIVLYRDNVYGVLDWQRVGARLMVQHYLEADIILHVSIAQSFITVLLLFCLFCFAESQCRTVSK